MTLRSNQLSGPAAPLTRCTALTRLDVAQNKLTGPVPATPVRRARAPKPARRARAHAPA